MGARRIVTVILDLIPTGFVGGLRTATVAARDFGKELDTMAVKHTASFNKISNTIGLVGAGLVGAFALAERATIAFDTQMSKVGAVADASAKQLDQLRAAALQAGKETAFTAVQAAQAEEELAKAGVGTADILGGALAGTLNLAAAGTLDLGTAATIAAQAMVEFGLKGKDVGHIADVLSAGANKSVASVSSLGEALDQVGAVAHNAHFSLDETVGVLAAFSNQGLDGEEAGTALKTALIKLQNPTNKAADLMKHLGINLYDANGRFIDAAGVAQQLQSALGGVTEAQRNAALATIFGTRAIRGAVVLYNLGAQGVQQWTDAVNASGAASDTSNKKLDNLSGDIHKLGGSLQALAIGATSQANQGLRVLAQGAESAVNAFVSLPGPVQAAAGDIVAFGGVTLLATAGFLKVRGAVLQFNAALAATGPLGEKAAGVLATLGGKAGVIGLAAVAVGGIAMLIKGVNDIGKSPDFKPATRNIDELTTSLEGLAKTGQVGGYLASTFGKDLSKLATELKAITQAPLQVPTSANAGHQMALENINDALHNLATQGTYDAGKITQSLLGIVQAGGTTTAHLAFLDVQKQLLALGVPMSTINKEFADYITGAQTAALGSSSLAKGMANVSESAALMNEGLATAISRGETLKTVFDALNGANISVEEANIAFNQSLDDLSKALKKNKDALDIHTQAGRDDMTAILDGVKLARDAAEATFEQTNSVDDASAAYQRHIKALRDTLSAAGLTKAEIDKLLAAYAKMPPVVSTQINAPGLPSVLGGIQQIYTWMGKLNGRTATIHVNTENLSNTSSLLGKSVNRWGGMYTHAAVGSLREAVYSPPVARGARYAYAEPETKGEIFIPKAGNYGRSMALIRAAAGWYGASVMPGGGAPVVNIRVSAAPNVGAKVLEGLRFEVDQRGGNVQTVVGRN